MPPTALLVDAAEQPPKRAKSQPAAPLAAPPPPLPPAAAPPCPTRTAHNALLRLQHSRCGLTASPGGQGRLQPPVEKSPAMLLTDSRDVVLDCVNSQNAFAVTEADYDCCLLAMDRSPLNPNWVAVAGEGGMAALLNVQDGRINHTAELKCPALQESAPKVQSTIFELAFHPQQPLLALAKERTAYVTDLSRPATPIACFPGHKRAVRSLAFRSSDPHCMASGSRDGQIMLWDRRSWSNKSHAVAQFKARDTLPCAHWLDRHRKLRLATKGDEDSHACVTGLTYLESAPAPMLLSAGADGRIKVWDLRRSLGYRAFVEPVCTFGMRQERGITSLSVDALGTRLAVAYCSNEIVIYDGHLHDPDRLQAFIPECEAQQSFYTKVKLSSDGKYLATGSSAKNTHQLLQIRGPRKSWQLNGEDFAATPVSVACPVTTSRGLPDVVTCEDAIVRLWQPVYSASSRRRMNRVDLADMVIE